MEFHHGINETNCKIKRVIQGSDVITPLIINVDNRSLGDDELTDCKCTWHKEKSDPSTCIINFSNSEKDNYQGVTRLQSALSKTMLVIQNKKTNKVQLIEVNRCQLGRVFEKPNLRTDYDNDEVDATYQENKSKLLRAFGSKKGIRTSEIGSRMKINSEVMESQIKDTAADVTVNVREIELADQVVDTCMPKIHRDAVTPEGVYLLEDFLSPHELSNLEDEAFTIFHLMPFTEEESGYSQFFINSLNRLQHKLNLYRIKALLYAEALMRYLNLPERKFRKRDLFERVCPFSALVAKKIIENFTIDTATGRIRNVTMEDKIVIHTIALIIIACDSCNVEEFSRCVPIFNSKKIAPIVRSLCLSSRDKITWFVKLPLPAQRSAFMRKRK